MSLDRATWVRIVRPLWPWLVLGTLVWLGWHELAGIDVGRVRATLRQTPPGTVLLLLFATVVNLAVAGLYDVFALAPRGAPPGAGRRWRLGALSFAWSNFFTFGPLAGPALRLWLWKGLGVPRERSQPALVAIFAAFATGLGCWCMAVAVPLPGKLDGLAGRVLLLLPIAALAVVAARVVLRRAISTGSAWRWPGSPAAMIAVAVADWLLAWVVFHLALSESGVDLGAAVTLRAFFLGQLVGLISFVPGGLGSADAFWMLMLAVDGAPERTLSALILYRVVYYVLPWLLATLVLLARWVKSSARTAAVLRSVMATYTFLCGIILLVSAATPALKHRLSFLAQSVPLAVIELSHGISVLLGFLLLVVSRGLARGYRSSARVAMALFCAAALATFLKGLDYEEALLALLAALLLVGSGRAFDRTGRLDPPWEFTITVGIFAIVLFAAVGAGSNPLPGLSATLQHFAIHAHGPRFLRALLLLAGLAAVVALHFALRPRIRDRLPGNDEIEQATIEARSLAASTDALLVAVGDKALFRTPDATGYVAYRSGGRFLVAYADPVCRDGDERRLLAAFLEHAASVDRDAVLYQISPRLLPVAHDLGFNLFKLGEQALVDLTAFDLRGNKAKSWRHALNSAEKAGATFEIVPAARVGPLIPELREVSDAWLADKRMREMQFSIGGFDEDYLRKFPCAIVRNAVGRVAGFANLLEGAPESEVSIDLMRYRPEEAERTGLRDVMDYLILRVMLHGKERGFRRFNLGMAPLAFVGEERRARPVERMARVFSRFGGHWFSYEGLRRFKEKFNPVWEPRYLAYPRPWDWLGAVASVTRLITGGWWRLLFRFGTGARRLGSAGAAHHRGGAG